MAFTSVLHESSRVEMCCDGVPFTQTYSTIKVLCYTYITYLVKYFYDS
jgi:hypothetical protein